MFNFLKKRDYLSITDYPESWSVLEAKLNHIPVIIRINLGYEKAIGHPEYPIKLGISIPIKEHNKDIEELKYDIEEYLHEFFSRGQDGVLVAIISGLGNEKFIEFLSYTGNHNIDFERLHTDLNKKFKNYDIQMYAENEPKWQTFKILSNT